MKVPTNYGDGYGENRPRFNFRLLISLALRFLVGALLCYYVWLYIQIPRGDEVAAARTVAMKELSRFSSGHIDPDDFDWAYNRENGTWTLFTVKDHHVYYVRQDDGHVKPVRRDASYSIIVDPAGVAHLMQKAAGESSSMKNVVGEGRDDT